MIGGLIALGAGAIALYYLAGNQECTWTPGSVAEWLDKWGALDTIVMAEDANSSAPAAAIPGGAQYAILLRQDGEWLFGIATGPNAGWWPGDGYKADYCAGKPPGDHLAAPAETQWDA